MEENVNARFESDLIIQSTVDIFERVVTCAGKHTSETILLPGSNNRIVSVTVGLGSIQVVDSTIVGSICDST